MDIYKLRTVYFKFGKNEISCSPFATSPRFARSYNRAYLATAYAFAQIQLRRTSDMLRTLSEMPAVALKRFKIWKEINPLVAQTHTPTTPIPAF